MCPSLTSHLLCSWRWLWTFVLPSSTCTTPGLGGAGDWTQGFAHTRQHSINWAVSLTLVYLFCMWCAGCAFLYSCMLVMRIEPRASEIQNPLSTNGQHLQPWCVWACLQRSDNLWNWFSSFHYVGSRDWTQVVRLLRQALTHESP